MRPSDLSVLSDADRDKGAKALDAAFSTTDDLVRARVLLAKQLVRLLTGAALLLVTGPRPNPWTSTRP